jgi:hypothetical protein
MSRKFYLIPLLVYFILRDRINKILSSIEFLNFDDYEATSFKLLCFVVVCIIILLSYLPRIKNGVRSNALWVNAILLFSIIYLADRFFFKYWHYIHVYGKKIYFLDLILWFAFLETCVTFSVRFNKWVNSWRPKPTNKSFFIPERPLENIELDELGRGPFVKKILDELDKSYFMESYSIGIVGKWASGKSTFLNFISDKLGSEDRVVINFKPWLSQDSDSIVKNLLSQLSSRLNAFDKNFKNSFSEYYKALKIEELGPLSKYFESLRSSVFPNKTIEQEFDHVNVLLKRLNKQLIIIIDDLDRLDYSEVIEIFKLIRNTANFHNTIFLTAFDRAYVTNAVKQLNEYHPRSYIDKIFDFEFSLPSSNMAFLITKLEGFIAKNLIGAELPKSDCTLNVLEKFISSVRDLNRFQLSLYINYTDDSRHLLFSDFFLVELMRNKYPLVLNFISENNKLFFKEGSKLDKDNLVEFKSDLLRDSLSNNEKDGASRFNLSLADIEMIISLFTCLFSGYTQSPSRSDDADIPSNSIRRAGRMSSYVELKLDDAFFKYNEFLSEIKSSTEEQFEKYLAEVLSKDKYYKARQIFDLLNTDIQVFTSNKELHNRAVFALLEIEKIGVPIPKNLLGLLYNKNIGHVLKPAYLKDHFKKTFQNYDKYGYSAPSNIIASIVREMILETFDSDFVFDKVELEQINVNIFNNYLLKANQVDKKVFELYYNNYHDIDKQTNKVRLNPKASNVLHKFITKNDHRNSYFNFLPRPQMQPHTEDIYVFEPFIPQVFGSWENFEIFLKGSTDYEHLDELITYFERFKEGDFKTFDLKEGEVPHADFVNMQGKIKR